MAPGYLAAAFDLLNVRDLDIIEQAAAQCGHLVVGVFDDDLVEQQTGRRPVVPTDERVQLVAGVRGVGSVVVHHDWPHDQLGSTFIHRGDAHLAGLRPVVILDPRRESGSEVLREALGYAAMPAVA